MRNNIILSFAFVFTTLFINAQDWQTDLTKATEIASKENKTLIVVFQGSDWCAPCIKLDREIWSTDEFIAYAKNNFVMLKADFPKRKKNALTPKQQEKNNKLLEKFNKNGYFPFVVILDKNGTVLGETGYKKLTPKKYIDLLTSF